MRWYVIPLFFMGAGFAQLSVEEAVAPVYPETAAKAGTFGSVIVNVQVSGQGKVTGAAVEEGDAQLQKASLDAARQWRFQALPGRHEVKLIFSFKLMPKNTPEAELGAVFRPPYTVEVRRITPAAVSHVARSRINGGRSGPPGRDRQPG